MPAKSVAAILISLHLVQACFADEQSTTISDAKSNPDGILVHQVESPYQAGATQIRVLLPEKVAPSEKLPVVYILPVEAKNESRYGDGLLEIHKLGLHNKHRAVYVAPTFSHLPWYANHPTDPQIRQETHLLKVVVPFVDKTYGGKVEHPQRLLLGFSKSGWGAWSLLLRHPDVFARAAAWDAPIMMERSGKYGSEIVFGTDANFRQYQLAHLLKDNAAPLRESSRLVLTGFGNFRSEHQQCHALLNELSIPHVYRDGPRRSHDWHSGWVAEALELLLNGEK